MRIFLFILISFLMVGCASDKGLIKLEQIDANTKSIVIVKDQETRKNVLPIITKWFEENDFSIKVVESLSDVKSDEYAFTYKAWWGWDVGIYMKNVLMEVILNNQTLAHLKFDALQYGVFFGKFGSGEKRLRILLDVLFGKMTREEADKLLGEA